MPPQRARLPGWQMGDTVGKHPGGQSGRRPGLRGTAVYRLHLHHIRDPVYCNAVKFLFWHRFCLLRCAVLVVCTIVSEKTIKFHVIREIADGHEFFETQAMYATNMVTGFIRMNGRSVGVVANQPKAMAGCIDINASDKAARFIRTCDCFNVPLLSIVDVPGYMPGTNQEYGGIIRHGAKMIYAWAEATVPKIVMAVGKVVGGARPAMCSWELRPDFIFAWPTAQMVVVGAEGAVDICRKHELKRAEESGEDVAALRAHYIEEYKEEFFNPYKAAEYGKFEDVIEPAESRRVIIRTLELFQNKQVVLPAKKHGNMPV